MLQLYHPASQFAMLHSCNCALEGYPLFDSRELLCLHALAAYRGDVASARAQVGNSISLALALGTVCVLVLELCTTQVLHLVAGANGLPPETMQLAITFLRCSSSVLVPLNGAAFLGLWPPVCLAAPNSAKCRTNSTSTCARSAYLPSRFQKRTSAPSLLAMVCLLIVIQLLSASRLMFKRSLVLG
jgi:hypothetical protein